MQILSKFSRFSDFLQILQGKSADITNLMNCGFTLQFFFLGTEVISYFFQSQTLQMHLLWSAALKKNDQFKNILKFLSNFQIQIKRNPVIQFMDQLVRIQSSCWLISPTLKLFKCTYSGRQL